jgi:uncharacterized protein YdaT
MARKEWHVVSNPDGGWDVKKPHAMRASIHSETKSEAVDRARKLCKKEGAELVIHGKDGKIQESNSYGNDPYPPRDK